MTRIPFHPVLFAILPVLSMFAANPGEGYPLELRDSIRVVVAATPVLLLATSAVYRDVCKAALLVSVIVLVFVSFDWVYAPFENISAGAWRFARRRFVVPLTYLGLAAWAAWLYRRPTRPARLTAFANLMASGWWFRRW
jgi:hypothetical protein